MKPRRAIPYAAVAGISILVGCNLVLGGGGYDVVDDRVDASQTADVTQPGQDGSDDAACKTDPKTTAEFEAACTDGVCAPFDNNRLASLCTVNGTTVTCPPLPPPPTPGDAGPTVLADAGGLPPCSSIPGSTGYPAESVWMISGDAMQPNISRVSQLLASRGIVTVFFSFNIACNNVTGFLDQTPLAQLASTAFYFDPNTDASGNVITHSCAVDNPTQTADLGAAILFPQTCRSLPNGLPSNVSDFLGSVVVTEFAVPQTSQQTTISAEAAYMTFGFGGDAGAAPWTDPTSVLIRGAQSGVVGQISPVIGVPSNQWKGTVTKNFAETANALIAANTTGGETANKSIGIFPASDVDSRRIQIKPLAFQDVGQKCGYYADSTPTSFDKQNVRDGHYPIWGINHFLTFTSGGVPINPNARKVINVLTGAEAIPGLDIIQIYATNRNIPNCAMKVQRTKDDRELTPFRPQNACGCYYEKLTTGSTKCRLCKSSTDCVGEPSGATSCNFFGSPAEGYCELPGN